MDSLIGVTCKVENMVLITRNEKDFKNMDIENGCYVEGDALLGEDKTDIYPKNEH